MTGVNDNGWFNRHHGFYLMAIWFVNNQPYGSGGGGAITNGGGGVIRLDLDNRACHNGPVSINDNIMVRGGVINMA